MGAQTTLLQQDAHLVKPNIPKQGVGHCGAVHVVFDYNASRTEPSYCFKTATNSIRGGKGEPEPSETHPQPPPTAVDNPTLPKKSIFTLNQSSMPSNGVPKLSLSEAESSSSSVRDASPPPLIEEELKWDWDIEHEDRQRERKHDAALRDTMPFEVDRRLLKDVVREKMGIEVGRIKFMSAGTFHKAYLVTLVNRLELVARVARRFMPRLKTESEVATVSYLREKTTVPVPRIYHYDSNPWNRLGGEFILMSKAPGIPLSTVYHGLSYSDLAKLVKNLASITIQLFAHRFSDIGSLYFGGDPRTQAIASGTPTPKAALQHYSGFPFSPTLGRSPSMQSVHTLTHDYHVGPIISWPFFGSNRGELVHPTELNRGPWPSTGTYLESCVQREIDGVRRENAGSAAPHRLHLDPDEIQSSRHHKLRAVPGDESDDSDEYDLEESEEEWEGPGSAMYRDYRRNQRSTFLVAHLTRREEAVKQEMGRWKHLMERLVQQVQKENTREEFGLDCHDMSLENVFVDAEDHTKITCVIDWESTTTRPLWASAHVPTCLQSSPFVSKLFRKAVAELPTDPTFHVPSPPSAPRTPVNVQSLCAEWLYYEAAGARLRMAHRCAEWDGWEEGLVDSILGPEEFESEWFRAGKGEYDHEALKAMIASPGHYEEELGSVKVPPLVNGSSSKTNKGKNGAAAPVAATPAGKKAAGARAAIMPKLPFVAEETQKEKMMNVTGDICGGRGGELGRRLEAWLTVTGGNEVEGVKKWKGDEHEQEEMSGSASAEVGVGRV